MQMQKRLRRKRQQGEWAGQAFWRTRCAWSRLRCSCAYASVRARSRPRPRLLAILLGRARASSSELNSPAALPFVDADLSREGRVGGVRTLEQRCLFAKQESQR